MAQLVLSQVKKSFQSTDVIRGVDLTVEDGEFCVFVGPSGCGKSTLLRLIAGLEECSSGSIHMGGQDVTHLSPAKRQMAMVFQSYALYPHMTVAQNMGFGLKMSGAAPEQVAQAVAQAAGLLQIEPLLSRRPRELSGGQRQRVAIGRAIVRNPQLFLLDEPLSNLDAALRVDMRLELAQLHRRLGSTFIYVTHDQVEAMTLADRIVVLRDGRIEQSGPAMQLYQKPANLFVAGFIGSPRMNFFPARLWHESGEQVLQIESLMQWRWPSGRPLQAMPLTVGIRPENMRLVDSAASPWQASVNLIERLGGESLVHLVSAGQAFVVKVDGEQALRPGQSVGVLAERAYLHAFDAQEQRMELEMA